MPRTLRNVNRDNHELMQTLEPIVLSWLGKSGQGVALRNTAVEDADNYAVDAANAGTGKKGLRAVADSHSLTVNGSGITLSSAAITGDATIGGTLEVDGNVTLGDNASDTLTVNAVSTFVATVNTQAATNLGNGAGDLVTVIDLLKVQNAAGSLVPLYVDGANGRTQVGSTTAYGTAPDSVLEVKGRSYFAPASAGDAAVSLRRSAASTSGWDVGVTSGADLVFKDDAGGERFRVGDAASTYAATVTGRLSVTTSAVLGADLTAARAVIGTTTFSGSEELRVSGQSRLEGEVEITTGNLKLSGSAARIIADFTNGTVGNRTLFKTSTTDGATSVGAMPDGVSTSASFAAFNNSTPSDRVTFGVGGTTGAINSSSGITSFNLQNNSTTRFTFGSTGISFFASAEAAKQTVTGSRGGNAALASLLTALATYGLITDSSS